MITPEMISTVRHKQYRMLIHGELVEAVRGETFPSIDPAVNEPLARVPSATAEDIDRAVAAAKEAFPKWRLTAPRAMSVLVC